MLQNILWLREPSDPNTLKTETKSTNGKHFNLFDRNSPNFGIISKVKSLSENYLDDTYLKKVKYILNFNRWNDCVCSLIRKLILIR